MAKKIIFASDYRGVDLKKQLFEYAKTLNREIKDIGIDHGSTIDYIDITKELVTQISNEDAFGVIVCGSGQGVAMVANRYVSMRAAVCRNKLDAENVRSKLDANILCLGSKQTTLAEAIECLNTFINTKFKAEKHEKCVSKLSIKPSDHAYNGINMIVRAIIIHEKHVLLSTVTSSNSHFAPNLFFLPGGHVDYNESAIEALRREIKEEMNIEALNEIDFVNALECSWNRKGNIYHELNLVYRVNIANLDLSNPPISTESSLRFLWCPLDKLKDYKILPEKLILVIQAEADPKQRKELFLSSMI
jgi:RpiB/LacA/LacB family sugar-phosphate isomerase